MKIGDLCKPRAADAIGSTGPIGCLTAADARLLIEFRAKAPTYDTPVCKS
jgi:hypothetical protein